MGDTGTDATTSRYGITQDIVASEQASLPGNCLQSAIATYFGRPMNEVPHFALFNSWHRALNLWLEDWYDLGARIRPATDESPPGIHLLIGTSPRGFQHVVVAQGEYLAWDPHPSRLGVLDRRETVVFYALGQAGRTFLAEHEAFLTGGQWP